MKTVSIIFQYAYLIVAVVMAFQAVIEFKDGGSRVWLYVLFALGALAMFFFKKHFNKKFKN